MSSNRFELLGVKYNNIFQDEALKEICGLVDSEKRSIVCFLNTDCLRQAQKDEEYRNILNSADLVISDGIGLKITTRLYGGRMVDNCNGTDLLPRIMEEATKKRWKIFFLGGKDGVAWKAAINIRKKIPGIQIVGTHSGYDLDDQKVIEQINASGADMLFVAMGVPTQEKWIARNRVCLNPKVCLGVGAFLDYLSGSIPRAPGWMQKYGIEWFWRVFVDPKRMFKRYFIDGIGFMCYVLFWRVRGLR